MIKAIIIDDEKKSREVLKRLLQELDFEITIIDEADGVVAGVKLVNKTKPQLVFLDVEMLDGTGFNFLERVNEVNFKIIFITAYDKYALRAFKYSALDYILKPINIEELEESLNRVQKDLQTKDDNNEQIKTLLNNIQSDKKNKKIAITSANKVEFIYIDEIACCKAVDSYTEILLKDGYRILASKPLKHFSEMLEDDSLFFRVDKSSLVNLEFIRVYKKDLDIIELENGYEMSLARRRKKEFLEKFTGI